VEHITEMVTELAQHGTAHHGAARPGIHVDPDQSPCGLRQYAAAFATRSLALPQTLSLPLPLFFCQFHYLLSCQPQ
jgi:hypothetical protein